MSEEKLLSIGDIFLDDEKRMVYVHDVPCELTYKEFELLKMLMQNSRDRHPAVRRSWFISGEWTTRVSPEYSICT